MVMTDRFDLEQQILECWKVTEDITDDIDAIKAGVANVNPTDTPLININTYNANIAGTYINFVSFE